MKPGTALALAICVALGIGASVAYRADQRAQRAEDRLDELEQRMTQTRAEFRIHMDAQR